jgi:membrane protease YdiL (CAAX protease family)
MLRVPFDLLVSYIMGYFVIRYRSVWPAVVFHFTNNLVNLVILNVLPSDGLQHFSSLSLALMAGTVVYLGWQIVRFLQRASAELRAEAAVVI